MDRFPPPHRALLARTVLIAIATLHAAWTDAADLLIENVTIVSPEQPSPSTSRHVLVRNERIAMVSTKPITAAAGTQRLDARGKFLTPGLMDSHVHVSEAAGLPYGEDTPTIASLRAAYTRQQPRSYLYFGVTQVLDLASFGPQITAFEAQPQRPDLFRCGIVTVLGGYPSILMDAAARQQLLPSMVFEPANAAKHPLPAGEDPAKHTVEHLVEQIAASGARCVKTFIEDGFGEQSDWPLMSTDTLKRLRAYTTKRGLLLVAHANAIDMQRIAVQAQVDVIAHGLWNWNEFDAPQGLPGPIAAHLRNVHAQKIGFQPTLRVLPATADMFRAETLKDPYYAKVVPPAVLAWYATDDAAWFKRVIRDASGKAPDEKIIQNHLQGADQGIRAVRYLHELGHPLLLGSDTPSAPTFGNQPGYDTYREMRMMAASGVSLQAILKAATINNARQFKLDKDYGTVESSKIANLLLLNSNPLQSVAAWADIDRIILRGKVIDREPLAASRHN